MVQRADIFRAAFERAKSKVGGELQDYSNQAASKGNIFTGALDAVNAAGTGIAKSGIETKEFLFGLAGQPAPKYEDRWPLQRQIEYDAAELDRRSGVNAFVGDASQFIAGMVGLGKVGSLLKIAPAATAGGTIAREVAKGALIGAAAFDPQEERLSNLLESYPQLSNPISAYLAADPLDTDAEGRFKNALEGIGMDLAISGVFVASMKLFRAMRGGDEAAIASANAELQAAQGGHMGDDQGTAAAVGLTDAQAATPTNQGSFEDAYGALADSQLGVSRADGTTPTIANPQGSQPALGTAPDDLTNVVRNEAGETIGSYKDPVPGEPLEIVVEGGARDADQAATPSATAAPAPLEVPLETQVDDLLKGFNADMDAITTYGSREAAELSGHRFGVSGNLPWQKLTDGGEQGLRVFTDQVASVFKTEMDLAKGGEVLSDARVEQMVAQRAALYGDDPASVIGMLQQAGSNANRMVADMEAGYLVANKAMMDVYRLATNIRMGNLSEFGGSVQLADKALKDRLAMAVDALAQSKAMTAAAGRSLRRMRGEFRMKPEDLAALKTMDIDHLVETLHASKGNPRALAQMANPGFMDRMVRGAGSLMANNLLWGWPTHAVNIATAAYMSMVRPAEKIVGSYFVKGGSGGAMRQAGLKEYGYMASAVGDAWQFAKDAWIKGDSILSPHQTEWFTAGGSKGNLKGMAAMGFRPLNTLQDFFHNGFTALNVALGMPTRTLGMMDEFIKQMSYRGYVQANAAVKAQELGLEGEDLAAYVQKALDDAFDGNFQATNRDALYEAQVRTFSQPLQAKGNSGWQTLGHALQSTVAQNPMLRAVFPFVKTPINVFRYAVKNAPLLNVAQKEYRDMLMGKMGPEQQAHAYGQMFVGSLALAAAGMAASQGKLTGGGPNEPNLRKAMEATGWKPYSLVIDNGDGTHTYAPYNRFDPVGMLMGIAADVTEMMVTYPDREAQADNVAMAAVMAVMNNLKDKTYLQSVSAALDAITDPDKSATRWVGQVGESLIPFSSALRNTNPDPYMREARTLMDHLIDRMPGFSQTLPPRRDPFGYPVKVQTGLVFRDNADDIVDAEQIRMIQETGLGIAIPTNYSREGIDLRDLAVERPDGTTTTAYDRLLEISIQPQSFGKPMKEAVADVIRSESYQTAPDGHGDTKGTKLWMTQRIITKYRDAAWKQLLREYPEEVGKPVGQRKAEVLEAYRRKSANEASASGQTMSQVQGLLAGYGIR